MLRTKITAIGLDAAARDLAGMGRRAKRPEPALTAHATRRELEDAAARRFRRGLVRDKATTIVSKRRRGLSTRTMIATGETVNAVTRGTGPASRALTFDASRDGLLWGVRRRNSRLGHLTVHAEGYRTGGQHVPSRQVIVIDRAATEGIAGVVVRHVTEGDQ